MAEARRALAAKVNADTKVGIEALPAYPTRIDVRSPSEFADDHVPGAINLPVLDDAERAEVGTLHARESAFAAKQRGAAIVARAIARIVETHGQGKPRDWAPLVYCWRGGKRSGALAHVLREIGWKAVQLEGGYRTWRRHVVAALAAPCPAYRFVVVCGLTGSGKSRLLDALAQIGAQVLDLEALARHRGSLLGDLPDDAQPTQKWFDSQLLEALTGFDPQRPVFVESESKRVGSVQLPAALLSAMRDAECIRLATPQSLRVALLKEDYAHFIADPKALVDRLALLAPLHGHKMVARWTDAADAGDFDTLVDDLLVKHYDPTYTRSLERNFPHSARVQTFTPVAVSTAAFVALAHDIVSATTRPVTESVT
ncbi:MAG: tRNA 2-selenouridine(34) synthase MnmH [Burkholderiales bacterium]|nr:tRNA 2-selenouridine(34) synthase MnmH [Burkholderiales bacterium]